MDNRVTSWAKKAWDAACSAESSEVEARAACAEPLRVLEWFMRGLPEKYHHPGCELVTCNCCFGAARKVLSSPNPGAAILAELTALKAKVEAGDLLARECQWSIDHSHGETDRFYDMPDALAAYRALEVK